MVFYFSGTGNSQLAAKQIAAEIDDEVVSISQCLREKKEIFSSQRPLVIVAPTYAWRIPKVVEHWIRRTVFTGSQDAYFVLTCGDDCGNATAYAKALCAAKGLRFCGLAPVVMPENYLALFPTPDEAEAQAILARATSQIDALAAPIRAGKPFPENKTSFADKLKSGPVNPLFYRFCVSDKGFSASEGCISCGLCARRCPLSNITIENKKPKWHGNCTHCMACIGGCPTRAIEYKKNSKGRPRYYIMED